MSLKTRTIADLAPDTVTRRYAPFFEVCNVMLRPAKQVLGPFGITTLSFLHFEYFDLTGSANQRHCFVHAVASGQNWSFSANWI